jgi:hypothetical protein
LWEIDSGIHKGWNSKDLTDENVFVKTFRFVGSKNGACRIGEVEVRGVEMYDSSDNDLRCTPKLTIGGISKVLSDSQVTYDESITPYLTNMDKRYGTVTGGTEITFTGVGFT